MKQIRLGATGLHVSRFCFGTMTFANPSDESESFAMADLALSHGVDFFDTANMYTAGKSEEILGKWMQARQNRADLVIASKVRYPVGTDRRSVGLSPKVIIQELEASLKRLQTDYLDIYYLHQPDDDTPIEVTLRCLQDQVSAGKIRYIGLSNFAAWQVADAVHTAKQQGWTQPLVIQPLYNAISRSIESELFPMTRHYDLANCVYNPLAGGLLTGKYQQTEKASKESRLNQNEFYRKRYWHEDLMTATTELTKVATQGGRSLLELALRFTLDSNDVHCVILGATHRNQLKTNLETLEKAPLTDEEKRSCDEVWERLRGPIPRYYRTNADVQIP